MLPKIMDSEIDHLEVENQFVWATPWPAEVLLVRKRRGFGWRIRTRFLVGSPSLSLDKKLVLILKPLLEIYQLQ